MELATESLYTLETQQYDNATGFDDITTQIDDVTTEFVSLITENVTTNLLSDVQPDFIKLTIYKINLILAAILTSFGLLNLFFFWSLLKFCPIKKTFNMYAVLICIADLINNLIIGPMYLLSWINPQHLTVNFCKVSLYV